MVALMMCLLINVVFRGILAALKTVSIPFLMEQYGVTYEFASLCLTVIGALGVTTHFSLCFFVHLQQVLLFPHYLWQFLLCFWCSTWFIS